jgi:ribose transport system substrate-binding protein
MSRRTWWAVGTAWAAAVVLAVSGCGSDDDDKGSESASSSASDGGAPAWLVAAQEATKENTQVPTEIESMALGPFDPPAQGLIYHVACNLALEGCSKNAKGLESGVKALGYEFKMCDGGTTADKIGSCFTNAINAKPDAIVVNGIGADSAADSFAKVAKAGIPLIGMYTGDEIPTENVLTEVGGDACARGAKKLAEWVIADSQGKANVLFVGTKTYACNVQREQAFTDEIKTCETCKVTSLPFAIDAVQSQLPQQLQSALQKSPDVDYVIGTFDAVALAATDAIRQAGKTDKIKVGGFDGDAPNLALIAKGDIQVVDVVTGKPESGWTAADAAARAMAGEKLPENLPVTSVVIDETNAAEIGTYDGPKDFEAQFRTLWGK